MRLRVWLSGLSPGRARVDLDIDRHTGKQTISVALARIEVRALGLLLGEVLDRCEAPSERLRALAQACTQPDPGLRPPASHVAAEIGRMAA